MQGKKEIESKLFYTVSLNQLVPQIILFVESVKFWI